MESQRRARRFLSLGQRSWVLCFVAALFYKCSLCLVAPAPGDPSPDLQVGRTRRRTAVQGGIALGLRVAEDEARAESGSKVANSKLLRCESEQQRLVLADRDADKLLRSDVVICGEHHNLKDDHNLERELLRVMADDAAADGVPLTVGLEMVERQFQPVLDNYLAGRISDDELYTGTKWETRWVWPWKDYLPIFQLAKERGVPLISLNPDTEVRQKVPLGGLDALTSAEKEDLVPDPNGFFKHGTLPHFLRYASNVIMPSYDLHISQQFVDKKTSARNFFAARTLRDEAMASRFANVTASRGGRGLLLVGADHVKYDYGVTARVRRYMPKASVVSVLLNPSPADTLSSSDTSLAVTMGNETDAPRLSDYVLFSSA